MTKRVTRRQASAWLSLMRDCLREMRFTGDVDTIDGYAVTIDPRDGCAVRIDYCIEGFLGLISRICEKVDTSALVTLKNLLAAQQDFSLEQIDAALRTMKRVERELMRCTVADLLSARLTEEIQIEIDAAGIGAA